MDNVGKKEKRISPYGDIITADFSGNRHTPRQSHQKHCRTRLVPGREKVLQAALLALKPLERVTVVWRYITGFKVAELVPVAGEAERDLYRYLSHALHDLNRWLKLAGWA